LQTFDLSHLGLIFEELGVPIAQVRVKGGTCKEDLQPLPACSETQLCMIGKKRLQGDLTAAFQYVKGA